VVVIDLVTKYWAVAALSSKPPVHVIGTLVMLSLVYNKGGAMGTDIGSSGYYLVVSLAILPVLIYYMYRHRDELSLSLPLAFIIGGAIGNLIDRIRLGRVVDFLDVDFFDLSLFGYSIERWWTFNVADACISVAIVYLLLRTLILRPQRPITRPFPEPPGPPLQGGDH